ncbi:hypothetical protein DMN91_008921 [Ooceraea biroi]|uniref:Zonadhesin n=1 Tax=Ooceraea biroi TaxID=2015173 RepID=A0A026W034_OOCBI|nr:hypothetical protein X777_11873 [Ooceraea biroi]RLU18564.1 hypothetical protein DMN91_008921 [Ooceraea biroi]
MQMQMLKIAVVLLIAGSGDARPQASGADAATQMETSDAGWRSVRVLNKSHDIVRDDSSGQSNDTHRDLKDLQYMDQSLRTVATQLLNVTGPQDVVKVSTSIKPEHDLASKSPEKPNDAGALIREVNSEISNLESMGVSFGRPINSKFGYFESSHPGQAMAITEEELEREMSTTRLITAYKNHPTTTGGISTWILLNPPSTTVKSAEVDRTKLKQPFQTEVKLTVRPSSSGTVDRVTETIAQDETIAEKTTMPQMTPVITTEKVSTITKKSTATTLKKIVTTARPERVTQDPERVETTPSATTLKIVRVTTVNTSPSDVATSSSSTTAATTKKNQGTRTTSKPKVTTARTAKPGTMKPTRPGQQGRPKPTATRRTTVKLETTKNETASTGKIEKVTFKPVQIITTTQKKQDNTERPMFVTKIKASVLMDTQKVTTTPAITTIPTSPVTTFKSNMAGADLVEVPVRSKPIGTKVNNILKVQLKKPAEDSTQIEVEPIKVNAPVLKIQKVDRDKMDEIVNKDTDELSNSRIDLKFDFNPELTKINVETQTEATSTTTPTATASSTTKRPRHNSKRKKNKVRRRKPSRTTTTATTPSTTTVVTLIEANDESAIEIATVDNAIQESKIAPETKIAPSTIKLKKKQPPKAISTQIYNFLSREVMPSFGVMSLVGLGLGLASYFLYPFGGTIARRNYETEPNYKYNLEEYGGNYGQSEEEVLSKVLQGMTSHDGKYQSAKDHGGDYYRYQHYDGAYDAHTTKRIDARYPSTSPIYRPAENTLPTVKYRNTDFRYPEAHTTPVHYDRKHLGDHGSESAGSANRQFVVGNVPKEYPYEVKTIGVESSKKGVVGYASTEVAGQTQFERDIAQGFNFPPNSANVHNAYGHLGASTVSRPDDGYEEIEITPTAVAVEHGPRSLKVKRAAIVDKSNQRHSRFKRESVIQVIPSKRELEEEREEMEKEEDLSNEILDIIDSALPGGEEQKKKTNGENNEVEDLDGQRKRHQEETNTRVKESTTKTFTTMSSNTEETTRVPENTDSTSKTAEKANDDGVTSTSSPSDAEMHSTSSPKDSEATTVEWFESSTTKKPTEGFSLFNFVKKVAEIKFRLGLTILKHASEGFARYLGHVQKRINGEE